MSRLSEPKSWQERLWGALAKFLEVPQRHVVDVRMLRHVEYKLIKVWSIKGTEYAWFYDSGQRCSRLYDTLQEADDHFGEWEIPTNSVPPLPDHRRIKVIERGD